MVPSSPAARVGSADQRVLDLLGVSDGLTRRAIGETLELPPPTVVTAVGRLHAAGAVVEVVADIPPADGAGRIGRPAQLVRLAGPRPVLGFVDLARRSLTAVISDWAGRQLRQESVELSRRPERLADLESAFGFLERASGDDRPERLAAVVLSVPAPFQPGVGVPAAPGEDPSFAQWLRSDPAPELSARFAVPVVVDNNANLAAFGEYLSATVQGARNLLCLRVADAWVGGGLVLDGRIHRGAGGFAGEIGHLHVDDDGPLCACGGRGCLVSRIGPLLAGADPLYGRSIGTDELVRLAAGGEPGPARVLTDLGRLIGRRVADLCTVLNLDAVVVAGEIGSATDLVAAGVREQIDLYAPPVVRAAVTTVTGAPGLRSQLLGAVGAVQQLQAGRALGGVGGA